jgi:hypothetical protein
MPRAAWNDETMASAARVLQLAAVNARDAADARAVRHLADALDGVLGGEKICKLAPGSAPVAMRKMVDHFLGFLEAHGLNLQED